MACHPYSHVRPPLPSSALQPGLSRFGLLKEIERSHVASRSRGTRFNNLMKCLNWGLYFQLLTNLSCRLRSMNFPRSRLSSSVVAKTGFSHTVEIDAEQACFINAT